MFGTSVRQNIRLKFLRIIAGILVISTVVLSIIIAISIQQMLRHSLMSKGQGIASYIAKLSLDPMIMKDYLQLDFFVNEANKDDDIVYIIIQDAQGNIITSQYSSINYRSPRFTAILSQLSKDSELPDIIAAVKNKEAVTELSVPILTGIDSIGTVTVCMSQQKIYHEMIKAIFFIIALNVSFAFVLGFVLFVVSKKTIIAPISELAHAADRLAKGDLSTRVNIKAEGEIQMLVDSFDRMAEDLEKTTVSRDYVDDIIGSMRDTLIVTSGDGTITRINMAACFLLGYDEAELVGQPIGRVIPDGPGKEVPVATMVLNYSSINAIEKTYLTKSGGKVPVLFSASVMRDVQGEVRAIVCMAQDMTERKRDEEKLKSYSLELQEINEDLKNFAYIVSHDLRSPLVNIKGFSDELSRSISELGPVLDKLVRESPEHEQQKYSEVLKKDIPDALTFIGSSVSRMDSIINSVLKLSRAGRRKLTPEPVIVKELVQTVVNSLAHQIGLCNVTVVIRDLPDVATDKTALEQIFGNLLDNAVKYLETERAGEIEVSAEQNGFKIVYHIRDNGRGISKEDIPRSFEIFRRVGRQDVPGEGIGLAYVKTLVRSLGGRIWCESEPGAGTTFSFALPLQFEELDERVHTGGR